MFVHRRSRTSLSWFEVACVLGLAACVGCSSKVPGSAELKQGCTHLAHGELDDAVANFGKAIDSNPKHALALFYRAMAYQEQKKTALAIAGYTDAIDLHKKLVEAAGNRLDRTAFPLDAQLDEAYFNRGVLFDQVGDRENALADYTEAIRVAPRRADAYCARGIAFLERGVAGVAFEDLREAVRIDPSSYEAHYHRARACLAMGKLDDAIQDCRTAIRLNPKCAGAFRTLGLALASLQPPKLAEADAYFREAASLDKRLAAQVTAERAEGYFNWGRSLGKAGDDQAAREAFSKAVEIDPGYVAKVAAYWNQRNPKKPAVSYGVNKPCPIADPLDAKRYREANASLNQGLIHRGNGDREKARQCFDKAIAAFTDILRKNAGYADVWHSRGLAFLENGSPQTAIADFNEAILLAPDFDASYCQRGRAHAELGDWSQAVQDCTNAIRLNPGSAANEYRAIAYVNSGRFDLALADLDAKAADSKPTLNVESQTWRAEAYQRRGLAKLDAKRWNDAIADMRSAVRIEPSRGKRINPWLAAAYRGRGLARAGQGEYPDAIKDLDEAVQLDPHSAENYRARGLTYHKMARLESVEGDMASRSGLRRAWELARDDLSRAILLSPELEDRLARPLAEAKRQGETTVPATVSQPPGI
jgi:tetratricopeptide (TPR) repeat protein